MFDLNEKRFFSEVYANICFMSSQQSPSPLNLFITFSLLKQLVLVQPFQCLKKVVIGSMGIYKPLLNWIKAEYCYHKEKHDLGKLFPVNYCVVFNGTCTPNTTNATKKRHMLQGCRLTICTIKRVQSKMVAAGF